MLQTRHRPDKENQIQGLPKTPGPGKSAVSKNLLKNPFHDENHVSHNPARTATKKSVAFGVSATHNDNAKVNAFQTPAPRRILGGKDLNTHQTPFQAPPSTIKRFDTHGPDAWSPPFTRPTHRRHSRKSSIGIRMSPVKVIPAPDVEVEDIEYMAPTAVDIPFEPEDYEPIDWDVYGGMKQDIATYFVKVDEFGKSEMDYFVERKMHFGADEELPVAPAPIKPIKVLNAKKHGNGTSAKPWSATKGKSTIKSSGNHVSSKPQTRPPVKSTRTSILSKPESVKFMREDLRDEVAALEMEELALCKNDDFGTTFDLEL